MVVGALVPWASLPAVFHSFISSGALRQIGRVRQRPGGARALANSADHAISQGQCAGRWSRIRRAEDAIRAGMLTILRRIVAVVAEARSAPVMVAAVRVRLNAMTARTSQAALALKIPEGRCARAEFFRSALTCSMIA